MSIQTDLRFGRDRLLFVYSLIAFQVFALKTFFCVEDFNVILRKLVFFLLKFSRAMKLINHNDVNLSQDIQGTLRITVVCSSPILIFVYNIVENTLRLSVIVFYEFSCLSVSAKSENGILCFFPGLLQNITLQNIT